MAIPTSKKELQQAIQINYQKLKKELSTIPEELTTIKELDGHAKDTKMSINNLLAYLIGWGELILKWNHKKDNNAKVDFPETGYKWNELGKLAGKFYDDYKNEHFNSLNDKLNQTVEQILYLVNSKSENELYEKSWYEEWTLGRMIQFNTSSPYTNARGRIRKWKKEHNLK